MRRGYGLARASTGPGRRCASCGAEVIWAVTDGGANMPIDLLSSEPTLMPEARAGNMVLWYQVDDLGRPIGKQRVSWATDEQRKDPNIPLWTSHFASCPHAQQHRRAR